MYLYRYMIKYVYLFKYSLSMIIVSLLFYAYSHIYPLIPFVYLLIYLRQQKSLLRNTRYLPKLTGNLANWAWSNTMKPPKCHWPLSEEPAANQSPSMLPSLDSHCYKKLIPPQLTWKLKLWVIERKLINKLSGPWL